MIFRSLANYNDTFLFHFFATEYERVAWDVFSPGGPSDFWTPGSL